MKDVIASIITDGYKLGHRIQYPQGTEYVYATWIPRSNRHMSDANGAIVFGIQYFIKKVLIDYFNENFFNLSEDEVVSHYENFIKCYLGDDQLKRLTSDNIRDLHKLGYLPIEIKTLEEGTYCPIGVPYLTIINTKPEFYWVTNYLETIISNELWLPSTSATRSFLYKKELVKHLKKTGSYDPELAKFLCHDFSMRGMACYEASISSGMAHLTSFSGSETLPAIDMMARVYNNGDMNGIAATVPATEHAVMSVGTSTEGELETYRRMMFDTFPDGIISIVSDTYDYWNVIGNYLPKLKDGIMKRNGRVVIRPDSGDPILIICGTLPTNPTKDQIGNMNLGDKFRTVDANKNVLYWKVQGDGSPARISSNEVTWEEKGSYQSLYDIFGGTKSSSGYKVLDTHIGLLYGDSISPYRQKCIYNNLEILGFSATNLVLGIGSYTYNYVTRDNLGMAMKTTWTKVNGVSHDVYKDPKTVVGMPKKSLKGLVAVAKDLRGKLTHIKINENEYKSGNFMVDGNMYVDLLTPVFRNGKILRETNLSDIRNKVDSEIEKELINE